MAAVHRRNILTQKAVSNLVSDQDIIGDTYRTNISLQQTFHIGSTILKSLNGVTPAGTYDGTLKVECSIVLWVWQLSERKTQTCIISLSQRVKHNLDNTILGVSTGQFYLSGVPLGKVCEHTDTLCTQVGSSKGYSMQTLAWGSLCVCESCNFAPSEQLLVDTLAKK